MTGGIVKDRTGFKNGRWTYVRIDTGVPRKGKDGIAWIKRCDCGTVRSGIFQPGSKSCGCSRGIGSTHINWKGGRRVKGGYVLIYNPSHHRAQNGSGYVAEHILIMEQHLKRELLRTEIVHHINGNRTDNRIENLELWDHAHPYGQRHSDKMRFYMSELLKKCDRRTLSQFCRVVLK